MMIMMINRIEYSTMMTIEQRRYKRKQFLVHCASFKIKVSLLIAFSIFLRLFFSVHTYDKWFQMKNNKLVKESERIEVAVKFILSLSLSLYIYIYIYISLSIDLCIYLSIYLFIYLSIYIYVCIYNYNY